MTDKYWDLGRRLWWLSSSSAYCPREMARVQSGPKHLCGGSSAGIRTHIHVCTRILKHLIAFSNRKTPITMRVDEHSERSSEQRWLIQRVEILGDRKHKVSKLKTSNNWEYFV